MILLNILAHLGPSCNVGAIRTDSDWFSDAADSRLWRPEVRRDLARISQSPVLTDETRAPKPQSEGFPPE